ncbi:hypothetical protein [Pseudomonas sp. CMR5c]|uniref:hypothetical protein n=1 Tax=Pseudomonas TaxID=286 RepID=UPI00069F57F1|nr:hypothetical protein [Pseudomonas sp. CMR5c]AZC19393.1 hypothetical protein C4K40_4009 [Pseudomonas sp. CMR5c]
MPSLTSNSQFKFDRIDTQRNAAGFWSWAFSNLQTPFLRGLLIEYLLCQHLIDHAEQIAGCLVEHFTRQNPYPDHLRKSLRKSFEQQHQGDVFDLQLTWGLTIEIKSTASPQSWRLEQTACWNLLQDRNLVRKAFQAHYYVLAELPQPLREEQGAIVFDDTRFHVLSRQDLETLAGHKGYVTFKQFTQLSLSRQQTCAYPYLPSTLQALVEQRFALARTRVEPGWKLPLPPEPEAFPLAVETKGRIHGGYYCKETLKLLRRIPVLWRPDIEPTWNDWELIGLRYVPER